MEEIFDILIAVVTIGAIIIRAVKNSQKKAEEKPVFKETEVFVEEEPPVFEAETFNRTTRSAEYAKKQNAFECGEGSESQEGKCIEPDANHCTVEHVEDSVYQTEISDETPVRFNRESLVQGIIMAEILSKPKWKE